MNQPLLGYLFMDFITSVEEGLMGPRDMEYYHIRNSIIGMVKIGKFWRGLHINRHF